MASLTQWTWVWVNSGSWWWTGRPGVLQSMRLQRVRHDLATELNWTFQNHPQILVCVCVFFKLFLWRMFPINLSKIQIELQNHLDWCIWTEEYVAFFGHGSKLSMIDEVKSPWLIASDAYTECVVCSLPPLCGHRTFCTEIYQDRILLMFSFRRLTDGLLKHWWTLSYTSCFILQISESLAVATVSSRWERYCVESL